MVCSPAFSAVPSGTDFADLTPPGTLSPANLQRRSATITARRKLDSMVPPIIYVEEPDILSVVAEARFCAILWAHEIPTFWPDGAADAGDLLRRHALPVQMAGRGAE